MRLVGDIALDAEVRAIASGAITDGAPVVVNADGTVSIVASSPDSLGSTTELYDGGFSFPAVVYDTGQDKFLLVYTDDSNSYYGTGVVGTVSGSSISFGTPVVFSSATSYYISATFDSNAGKTGIFWADYDDSERGKACVATISGTSVSYGSTVTFNSTISSSGLKDSTFDSSQNKIVLVYRKDSSNGEVVAATISGTNISFGSATSLYGTQFGSFNKVGITYDSNAGKSLVVFHNPANSNKFDSKVVSLSGSTVSLGSLVNILDGSVAVAETAYDSTNNKVIVAYRQDDTESDVFSRLVVGTISGTSVSYGTAVSLGRGFQTGDPGNSLHYDASAQKVIFVGGDIQDSYKGKYVKATVSGTSISIDSITTFSTRSVRFANFYDPDAQKSVLIYNDHPSASSDPVARTLTVGAGDNITSENFIGFAHAAYADGQKATVKTTGSIARNIPQQPIASSAGTPVAFDSGRANETSIVYDPNVNRFFIAYKARDNSSYGTGVVATLSGTSLSFGTPVVFESAEAKGITPVFDTNTNKIVITYKDVGNSERGTAIVATIDSSDNSVTYGSPVVYHTSESSGSFRSAAFVPATVTNNDDSANSIVVAFKDGGDSGRGKAVVGVVSGAGNTSTTWGTVATFNSGSTDQDLTVVNDTNAKRLLIAYRDSGNSNYGTAVVATVNSSDSSITFGSETVFHSAETDEICGVFDPDTNKIILCFHDGADGNKSKSIVATISGTSVSFGSVVTVNTGGSYQNSVVYDTTANKAIVSMRDDTNSRGISFTGTVSGTDISYDSGVVFQGSTGGALDFVASAFDPDTSKVAIVYNLTTGKGVVHSPLADGDLTIGQQYFVQTDGTLGTSADDPSVIAGTAIGTSELIVKG